MSNKVNLYWMRSANMGDGLNPFVFDTLFGDYINNEFEYSENKGNHKFVGCGSILNDKKIINSSIIGAGFSHYNSKFNAKNTKVYCVRGEMTLEKIRNHVVSSNNKNNIKIDENVSIVEPFMFMPLVLGIKKDKEREKKYKYGVIPHWVDYEIANNIFIKDENISIIDVILKGNEKEELSKYYFELVSSILDCECILSSSLHGIIIATSLGVPCQWVGFSDKIITDGFKFIDFISTVSNINKDAIKKVNIESNKDLKECRPMVLNEKFNRLDLFNILEYLNECVYKEIENKI